MGKYTKHDILVVEDRYRDEVNVSLEKHGFGPDNFSIPMEDNGKKIKYWATAWTMTADQQKLVESIISGKGENFRGKSLEFVESEKNVKSRKHRASDPGREQPDKGPSVPRVDVLEKEKQKRNLE